jgi:hypothetical protein
MPDGSIARARDRGGPPGFAEGAIRSKPGTFVGLHDAQLEDRRALSASHLQR